MGSLLAGHDPTVSIGAIFDGHNLRGNGGFELHIESIVYVRARSSRWAVYFLESNMPE